MTKIVHVLFSSKLGGAEQVAINISKKALAQSLPIVASNVGGINELIDRNGFLVKNDPQEISEKLLLLYKSNQIDEIKNNSYEMYQRHYTESEMLEETQDCYLRCLA
ncbi:hypothetical protein WP50_21260 [Lactiplantibacillus plantarum]|nr:hypothetical protein WP50_21260 [Lactiplantibacillus plantarum]